MEKYAAMMRLVREAGRQRWASVMEMPAAKTARRSARFVFYPLIAAGSGYSAMAAQAPFTTGFVTTGLKTTVADAFAQLVVEKRDKIDWRRNAMFTTFGFFYLGGFQYWLYNVKFTQWCGAITRMSGHFGSAPIKTFLDQCVHHPLTYFPVFYSLKATVEGRPILSGDDSALNRYRTEAVDCWKALWSIWVPAQLFNFTFTPRHLRIPFVAATSFVWTVTLSVMQGAFSAEKDLETEELVSKELAGASHVKAQLKGSDAAKLQTPVGNGMMASSVVEMQVVRASSKGLGSEAFAPQYSQKSWDSTQTCSERGNGESCE